MDKSENYVKLLGIVKCLWGGSLSDDVIRDLACIADRQIDFNESEDAKKEHWVVCSVARMYLDFIRAFGLATIGDFYGAWCAFEDVEHYSGIVYRHALSCGNAFDIERLCLEVSKWQSLFPYKKFASPGLFVLERRCNICNKIVDPIGFCGHREGEIYGGTLCRKRIIDFKALEASFVDAPEQKFSVIFLADKKGNRIDQYDYSVVKFLADRLTSPFSRWSAADEVRNIPIERFGKIPVNSKCPCQSGFKYKKCCSGKLYIRCSHKQFHLESVRDPAAAMWKVSPAPKTIKGYCDDQFYYTSVNILRSDRL